MDTDKKALVKFLYFPIKMTSYILDLLVEEIDTLGTSDEKVMREHIFETQQYTERLFKNLERRMKELEEE